MLKLKLLTQAIGAATLALVVASCVVGNPLDTEKVPANLTLPSATHEDLSYNPPGQNVAARALDLYLPNRGPNDQSLAPVIVYVHGGGWAEGDKAEPRGALKSFVAQVQRGYAVASINYRLSGEAPFPAAVEDVKLAVRWIKANAGSYQLDAEAVVLAGESAGGHLAALAAVSQGEFQLSAPWPVFGVQAVVDLVGPTDMAEFLTRNAFNNYYAGEFLDCPYVGGAYVCDGEILEQASVTTYIDDADPPVYMAYGENDPLVEDQAQGLPAAEQWALALGAALENNTDVMYDLVDGGGHDIALQSSDPGGTPEETRMTYHFAAMQQFLDNETP